MVRCLLLVNAVVVGLPQVGLRPALWVHGVDVYRNVNCNGPQFINRQPGSPGHGLPGFLLPHLVVSTITDCFAHPDFAWEVPGLSRVLHEVTQLILFCSAGEPLALLGALETVRPKVGMGATAGDAKGVLGVAASDAKAGSALFELVPGAFAPAVAN